MGDDQETKYCGNCKRQIAVANFVMHELHCRRNIVLCEHCQEPVPRSEMDAHFEEEHAQVPCELCQQCFEKSKIEDHKPSCPQRPATCEYCQLDMPVASLDQHRDYCGSRTEPCELCGNYIMHSQLQRHLEERCAFPPPKATQESASPPSDGDLGSDPADRMLLNSFAMNELSRILNEPSLAAGAAVNNQRATFAGSAAGASSSRRGPAPRTRTTRRPRIEVNRNFAPRADKRTNAETAAQRQWNTNVNVNVHSTMNNDGPGGRDNRQGMMNSDQLDELLARHLARDLGQDIDDGGAIDAPPPLRQKVDDTNDVCLPCEFCGDLFPVEIFVEHQSICNPSSLLADDDVRQVAEESSPRQNDRSWFETGNNAGTSGSAFSHLPSRNNSVQQSTRANSHPSSPPHLVDNLSFLAAQDEMASSPGNYLIPRGGPVLDEDETFLPCEFCMQLFPDNILVQHQAVCEADNRAPTPGYRRSRATPTSRLSPASRSSTVSSSLRTKSNITTSVHHGPSRSRRAARRQQDPTDLIDPEDHQPSLQSRSQAVPTGARSTLAKDSSWSQRGHLTVGNDLGSRTRQNGPRRASSRRTPATGSSVTGAAGASSMPSRHHGARRDMSLDELIGDQNSTTGDLLAALDKDEKSNRNQRTRDASVRDTDILDNGIRNASGRDSASMASTVDIDNKYSDVGPSGSVRGIKPRRRLRPPTVETEGASCYDPSFPGSSRPTGRAGIKPRSVSQRNASLTVPSTLRVSKPKTNGPVPNTSGTSSSGSNRRPTNGNMGQPTVTRKRTPSRPRKAPQGEP